MLRTKPTSLKRAGRCKECARPQPYGARTHRALAVFYSLAVILIGASLVLGGARWPAWIGLIAFAAHLAWQIRRLDISDPALCRRLFKSNRDAGLLLFAGLLVDAVMRSVS